MKTLTQWLGSRFRRVGIAATALLSTLGRFATMIGMGAVHLLSWAAFLALVLGIPAMSWYQAERKLDKGERLHAYFVTTRTLTPGTQITAGDVEIDIGYVGKEASVLPARDIVGRFAVTPLQRGSMITKASVSRRYEIEAAPGDIIVQVQVDKVDSDSIAPGSLIALTREKTVEEKDDKGNATTRKEIETLGLPACAPAEKKGLRVQSIARSEDKDQPSLLRIHLERSQAPLASALTLHEWKPIVLGVNACSP